MKRRVHRYLLAVSLTLFWLTGGAETTGSDWPLCPSALPIPERPRVDTQLEAGDIHISADEADLDENGVSILHGNVDITRDNQQISAESITYDEPSQSADLTGSVQYWDDALYLSGASGHVDFDTDSGEFNNARYVLIENRARGQAEQIKHFYPSRSELTGVDFTTCDPEDNFWKLSASEITLNHDDNWGSARNVVMRIKDVPVFYTPYISFPLTKERKTGFLFPNFGTTNRNGYELLTPFYWNIAPEMDATITPRLLTDSGLMFIGQFRYLLGRGQGEFNGEILPGDSQHNDDNRNLFSFTHHQPFADTGNFFLTYNRVSDKQYFEDFGSSINLTSRRYLERRANASYAGDWWNFSAMVQTYQTVDSSIPQVSRPYKRLPQLTFNAFSPFKNRQLNFGLHTELSYFDRGDNSAVTDDVNGLRIDIFPSVSYPIHTSSAYVEPKVGVRFTQYDLNNTGPLFDSRPNRLLPVVSLDSGLFFERDINLFNTDYSQTLEPRLFYLYIPRDDQTDLPVFDTSLYDFSFNSIFREDRFTGPDRMGDANQVTLAVTSRLIDQNSGREKGYISLGQIYYAEDRDVFLPPRGALPGGIVRTEASSPFIAEIGAAFISNWRFRGTLQYDFDNTRTEELAGYVQYNPALDKVLNMGYRVRRTSNSLSSPYGGASLTNIEQSDVSLHWPLGRNWSVVGRWNYAVPENRTLDAFGGIEYNSCCWAFRSVVRRFITDASGNYTTGVFFQIELKGLAGVGQKTADFLQENIPGYQSGF